MEDQAMPVEQHSHSDPSANPLRRRLGRGLSALLGAGDQPGDPVPPPDAGEPQPAPDEVAVELIERNPWQPRKDFDQEALGELTESIRLHGVLQPLLVRPKEGRYQLIAGERRWLAAQQAGLERVPCRVLELDDQHVCEVAIEENLKRRDLNVLEKARAFQEYLDRFACPIEELARRLSMNRSTVSNFLRLLELPDAVKESLAADRITNGHARALLSLEQSDQIALCERIQQESLSVRRTEEAVRALQKARDTAEAPAAEPAPLQEAADHHAEPAQTIPFEPPHDAGTDPHLTSHVLSLQEQLQQHLGTRVEIRLKAKDAGRIVIHFHTNDEFENVVRCLRRAA